MSTLQQALHIFRKDTRQFRYVIATVLAMTVVFAITGAPPWPNDPEWQVVRWRVFARLQVQGVLMGALPASWWLLIALVVHAEALPGDRHFWLTRPYSRAALVLAKSFSGAAYILLPMAMAQAWIVSRGGFSIWSHLDGLLWTQVLLIAVVIAPGVALASITANLTQFAIVLPGVVALGVTYATLPEWGPFSWVRDTLIATTLATACGIVVAAQYRRRRSTGARRNLLVMVLLILVAAVALPWSAAFSVQAHITGNTGGVVAALRPDVKAMTLGPTNPMINLGFLLEGVDTGRTVVCESTKLTLQSADRQMVVTPDLNRSLMTSNAPYACDVFVGVTPEFIEASLKGRVRIQGTLFVTVFGEKQQVAIPESDMPVFLPDGEACLSTGINADFVYTACRAAFRHPPGMASSFRGVAYSPLPAELFMNPVHMESGASGRRSAASELPSVVLETPVAHLRLEVDAPNVVVQVPGRQ